MWITILVKYHVEFLNFFTIRIPMSYQCLKWYATPLSKELENENEVHDYANEASNLLLKRYDFKGKYPNIKF